MPQEFDEHAPRVSMAPKCSTWLFNFIFIFYAKERMLQNQEKKCWVVRELLLFEAIKRNGTFPQPTEVITLGFISGKSTFNLVKI